MGFEGFTRPPFEMPEGLEAEGTWPVCSTAYGLHRELGLPLHTRFQSHGEARITSRTSDELVYTFKITFVYIAVTAT